MNDGSRGVDLMHELFGTKTGYTCMECDNLVLSRGEDRILKRCSVCIMAGREPENWQIRWKACGMFNKKPMLTDLKRLAHRQSNPESQIEGQMEIGGKSK